MYTTFVLDLYTSWNSCTACLPFRVLSVESLIMDSPFDAVSVIEARQNGAQLILTSRNGMQNHVYDVRRNCPSRRICVVSLLSKHEPISQVDDCILFEIHDDPDELLEAVIAPCLNFINANLAISDCTVIVHCVSGISRSSSIVIAYMADRHQCSITEATEMVKEKRSFICPNDGFLAQLNAWRGATQSNLAMSSELIEPTSSSETTEPQQAAQSLTLPPQPPPTRIDLSVKPYSQTHPENWIFESKKGPIIWGAGAWVAE